MIIKYEDDNDSRKEMLDEASKRFDIIIPKRNQLTLDLDLVEYDTRAGYDWFWIKGLDDITSDKVSKVLSYIYSQFTYVSVEHWASKTGKTHVLITLKQELPAMTRCLFQSLLGSDPVREMLNMRRIQHKVKTPMCLFKPNADKFLKKLPPKK